MKEITESLGINMETEMWGCLRCGEDFIDVNESYKSGCYVRSRNPRDVHKSYGEHSEYNFTPHPDWCRIVEFFCPECGTLFETEYLPPGHPVTHDIQVNIDSLREPSAD
jgi:acetophenone carboxylase